MKPALFLYRHTEKPTRDGRGGPRIALTYDGGQTLPDTYVDQLPFFLEKLRRPEMVRHIIDECGLVEDEFEGDETFAFKNVEYRDFGIVYTFKNSKGEEHGSWFAIESVTVL